MKHPEYEEFGFEWVDEMYPQNKQDEIDAAIDEDWAEYDDDLEMGFDPYEGCYTWDC